MYDPVAAYANVLRYRRRLADSIPLSQALIVSVLRQHRWTPRKVLRDRGIKPAARLDQVLAPLIAAGKVETKTCRDGGRGRLGSKYRLVRPSA